LNQVIDSSNRDKILVIIPVYNEEHAVIYQVVDGVLELGYNVLIIDDGSEIKYDFRNIERLNIVTHDMNSGQGEAINTGFRFAINNGFDYCISFDGDGQHDPDEIKLFGKRMRENPKDILLGSRFLTIDGTNVGFVKKIVLKCGILLNYMLSGILLTDSNCGYRMFNKKAMKLISFQAKRMGHASELMWLIKFNKLSYSEVPVNIKYTDYSKKKGQHLLRIFPVTIEVLKYYIRFRMSRKPLV